MSTFRIKNILHWTKKECKFLNKIFTPDDRPTLLPPVSRNKCTGRCIENVFYMNKGMSRRGRLEGKVFVQWVYIFESSFTWQLQQLKREILFWKLYTGFNSITCTNEIKTTHFLMMIYCYNSLIHVRDTPMSKTSTHVFSWKLIMRASLRSKAHCFQIILSSS